MIQDKGTFILTLCQDVQIDRETVLFRVGQVVKVSLDGLESVFPYLGVHQGLKLVKGHRSGRKLGLVDLADDDDAFPADDVHAERDVKVLVSDDSSLHRFLEHDVVVLVERTKHADEAARISQHDDYSAVELPNEGAELNS